MFDGDKYITRGISESVPSFLQQFMWKSIDNLPADTRDYLQIFKLRITKHGSLAVQEIEHSQENPPLKTSYLLDSGDKLITAKIYVIDDTAYSTMLLADEY